MARKTIPFEPGVNTGTVIQLVSLQFILPLVVVVHNTTQYVGAALLTKKKDSLVIHIR